MSNRKPNWELIALAFALTFTMGLGLSYVLGVAYRLTIPWPVVPVIALLAGLAAYFRGRRA